MTVFQERLPNDYASLVRRIEALERDLQQARAAKRLEAATIGRGGITIKGGAIVLQDSAGHEIARMGIREDLNPGPDGPQPGFILRRNDGSVAFTLDDPDGGTGGLLQMLKIQDAKGNIIFAEDRVSGWGMSSPTFTVPLFPFGGDSSKWPVTASTTFTSMWGGLTPLWNPRIEICVYTLIQGGATGEIRLMIGGQLQGSVTTVSGSATTTWTVDATSLGFTPGTVTSFDIQARMTAPNTGPLNCTPQWLYGGGSF